MWSKTYIKQEQHINAEGEVSDTAELYRSFLLPLICAVNEDGVPPLTANAFVVFT